VNQLIPATVAVLAVLAVFIYVWFSRQEEHIVVRTICLFLLGVFLMLGAMAYAHRNRSNPKLPDFSGDRKEPLCQAI
jgi:lipopolysaccharide export LptBFGC system permease protein LptF